MGLEGEHVLGMNQAIFLLTFSHKNVKLWRPFRGNLSKSCRVFSMGVFEVYPRMIRIVNRNQTVTIRGKKQVGAVLQELNLLPETVLVIRGNTLLMTNDVIDEKDEVEIRPVISGGVFVAHSSG